MTHGTPTVKSGKYTLKKMTKTQVRNLIRDSGRFQGFLCGNKVNPYHIADGWGLGYHIEVHDPEDFEKEVDKFETGLHIHTPELGRYAHYYEILKSEPNTEQ